MQKFCSTWTRVAAWAFVFSLVFSTVGCQKSGRPSDMPKLVKIKIVLTQEGQPLVGALVNMIPTDETSKYPSGGTTDDKGICEPRTRGKFQGAPAGTYDVTVSKQAVEETGNMIPGAMPGQEVPETKNFNLVDAKYGKPGELKLEVKPDGDKTFTFELGAAVKEEIVNGAPGAR